jgi:hypothetical protein
MGVTGVTSNYRGFIPIRIQIPPGPPSNIHETTDFSGIIWTIMVIVSIISVIKPFFDQAKEREWANRK